MGLRVMMVHAPYRVPGGEDAVVATDVAALRAAGHEVLTHFVPNEQRAAAGRQLAISTWNPVQAQCVRRVAAKFRPDVIHVHNTWFALSMAVLRASHGIAPTVMTAHNYRIACANGLLLRDGLPCELCVGASPLPAIRYRCYRDSLVQSGFAAASIALAQHARVWSRFVDRFIVLNEFAAGILGRSGLPKDRMIIRANRVLDPGDRPQPPSVSRDFLYVGRLSAEKGVERLIQLWRRPAISTAGWTLKVVGPGSLTDELRIDTVRGVRLLGQLEPDEVSRLMLTSRSLLFPSICYENQPLTVLEAMAAGLPIIASDIGAVPAMLRKYSAGFTATAADVTTWEGTLTTPPTDIDEAGRSGRRAFKEHFCMTTAARSLVEVYEQSIRAHAMACVVDR